MTDTTPASEAPAGDPGPWEGPARGGPLDGQACTSRYPRGALAVRRSTNEAWLYDWTGDGFTARAGGQPMELVDGPDGSDNRMRAAEEGEFDVWVVEPPDDDPDAVDAYAGDDQDVDPHGEDPFPIAGQEHDPELVAAGQDGEQAPAGPGGEG